MDEVYKGNGYMIERGNKPMAVIIPMESVKGIKRERKEFFDLVKKIWKSNENVDPEEIEKNIKEGVGQP